MTNRPEYFAIWLGITSVGAVVSLLNTNLVRAFARSLHAHRLAAPRHVSSEFVATLQDVLPHLDGKPLAWAHGAQNDSFPRIDEEIERYSEEPLGKSERRTPAINDLALYIYTSGTTGMPKAAKVSHGRTMQWSHWFAGMMDVQPSDRMYNCLPMYHSVGGVQVMGAMLAGGGSVVLREKFSARQFWSDVVRWDCTLIEYIGELCRYLASQRTFALRYRASRAPRMRQRVSPEIGTRSKIASRFRRSSSSTRPPRASLAVQRAGKKRSYRPHPALSGASFCARFDRDRC